MAPEEVVAYVGRTRGRGGALAPLRPRRKANATARTTAQRSLILEMMQVIGIEVGAP
jgi:cell division protein FtsN